MKKSFKIVAFLLVAILATAVVNLSCSSKKVEQSGEATTDSTKTKETMPIDSTQAAFACPMHPEITGKEGDKCSKCGMELEAKATEHQH